MSDVGTLLERCRLLGATFIPFGDRFKVRAPEPLPEDLVAALRELKAQVLAELDRERQNSFRCWVLDEWRRVSIPDWRRILQESIEQQDTKREDYARWMLREILIDPEYGEPEP